MRLIDADKLMEKLNECFYDTTNNAARRAVHDTMALCQSLVDEQPTAYDVDKVVERLEELIKTEYDKPENCNKNKIVDGEGIYEDGRTQGKYEAYKKSLKIVKSGGIHHPDSSNTDTENVTVNWKEHLASRFNRFE